MPLNDQVALWLEISKVLLGRLTGPNQDPARFGIGMEPDAFGKLVDEECLRVDHALTAMAVARDEGEVVSIFGQLNEDTRICLLARWLHYMQVWKLMLDEPNPHLWVPPKENEIWRAVFLAMTGEGIHSSAAMAAVWPGRFG